MSIASRASSQTTNYMPLEAQTAMSASLASLGSARLPAGVAIPGAVAAPSPVAVAAQGNYLQGSIPCEQVLMSMQTASAPMWPTPMAMVGRARPPGPGDVATTGNPP